ETTHWVRHVQIDSVPRYVDRSDAPGHAAARPGAPSPATPSSPLATVNRRSSERPNHRDGATPISALPKGLPFAGDCAVAGASVPATPSNRLPAGNAYATCRLFYGKPQTAGTARTLPLWEAVEPP